MSEKKSSKDREELNDENFQKLFTVLSHYVFSEVENMIPFDKKTDDQREEIAKIASKTMETTAILMCELIPEGTININKLSQVEEKLKAEDFKGAHKLLCVDEE